MASQTTVQLKRSSVAGKVPDAANIDVGEPVVNLNDKIIFTKDGNGNVIVIGAGTTSNVTEGNKLYFTDARVATALTNQTLSNATFSSDVRALLLYSTQSSGDEGGQLNLAKPAANTTINGEIAIDVYQDKLRIFETGGTNRGAFIDFNAAGSGVSSNILAGGGGGGGGSGTITNVAGVASGSVSNTQLASGITSSGVLTTANVSEVTNLYYTDSRVYSNVTQLGYITSSSLNGYATNSQLSAYALDADLTTANVTELTNLYYTNARVYANVTPLLDAKASLTGATFTGNVIATNLLPPSDDSGTVGDANRTWNNGHFTNLSVDTLGSISGTLNVRTALDLGTDDVLRFGDADSFEIYYDGTNSFLDLNSGNLVFRDVISNRATFVRHTGDLILSTGNSQANYFIGDGSALTNVRVSNSNITGNTISSKLEPTGVTAGSYGGATNVAAIVIDQQGRITSASNAAITASGGGGGGSPFNTSVSRNAGLALTTAAQSIFTAPSTAGVKYVIHSIHVTNINTIAAAEVTGSFNGTTYSSNINFINTLPVPIGTAVELLRQPKVLQANDIVYMQANVDNALHAVITYETQTSSAYFGSGVDITTAGSPTTLHTANANSMIQSILLTNDDSTTLDVKARVTWTDASDVIQGYYCFDLTIPNDSTVEILEAPKYLENGHKIRVQANQANRLEAIISGKTI